MALFRKLGVWASLIRLDVVTLGFACFDAATPWYVRGLCLLGAAYLISPIDLIPDFIPIVGLFDDALVIGGVIWLALRLLPEPIRMKSQTRAAHWLKVGKTGLWITLFMLLLCVAVFSGGMGYLLWRLFSGHG